MSDELDRLFVYGFQAAGRRRLLEEDLVRVLAHERRWFPPSRVRALVAAGRERGILRSSGAHAYELSPDARELTLPLDYRPDIGALETTSASGPAGRAPSPPPLFRRLIMAVSQATQTSETDLVAAVNRLQQETGGLLTAEAAAFVVARLRSVDVGPLAKELEDSFQRMPDASGQR